ncbi:hypothetical protein BPO_1039 [Bergeyella porcorum]|uniref:Uncharacterized protein n=1 Tax=Bergeyella porcorum TaxID=1735111 RepID=A0AAU0F6S3_9FLAO
MENLHPKDSLAIIETVINQRKQKYEENGIFLIFWGILVALAGIGQFLMITLNFYPEKSGFVWLFTMVPGFIFTFLWKMKEGIRAKKQQKTEDWSDFLWLVTGSMAFASMFVVNNSKFITMMIFLPIGIASLSSALRLKNRLWIFTSLISIVLAYSTVFFWSGYQPLFMAIIAVLSLLIPGIQLHLAYKKRNNV